MNTIQPVSFSRLNSGELYTFNSESSTILKPLAQTDEYVGEHLTCVDDSIARVVQLKTITAASEFSGGIEDADDEQDTLLITAKGTLKANIKMAAFFPAKAEASERTLALMNKRSKDLYYGNYTTQQGEIDALFEDFAPEEVQADLNESQVAPIFARIAEVNAIFKVKTEQRRNESTPTTTLRDESRIQRYHMSRILDYIDGRCAINSEGFRDVAIPLNDLIADMMGRYRARSTRQKNQSN